MDPGEPLYDTAAVRAIDRAAIASGIGGFELMRRAAEAAFLQLRQHWPEARRVLVACGRGNNGGDGYLVACLLREAGAQVWVCGAEPGERTSADARLAREAWLRHGTVHALDRMRDHEVDLAVDALFGIGLETAPDGEFAAAIEALDDLDAPVFSLDVPSGLDAQRGRAPGAVVRATRTITFIADKSGLHTGAARDCCGTVVCDDLDVDPALLQAHAPAARLLRPRNLAHWLRPRARSAHKGDHGHVLCVGGERGMGGAVRLCAEGALRAGAGWASVATRAEHVAPLLAARPEAMTRAVESGEEFAAMLERADMVAIGPGLGQGEWGRALLLAVLRSGKSCVLDADALNLLPLLQGEGWGEDGFRAGAVQGKRCITPHPGEAARLLGCSPQDIESDRYAAAARLAHTYDATVILKGAGTIVAAPDRTPAVIAVGNPGMGSAGMGDVLTGIVAALMAQGLDAFDAACAGALLHASAGDAAARQRGERGLLASDLFEHIQRGANP